MSGIVSIVDYGMGNLRSVENALAALGHGSTRAGTPAAIDAATALILPGVGAFAEAMQRLREADLVQALQRAQKRALPILGICLGMQLMAESSDEHGTHAGLGWIGGHVRRMAVGALPLPHVGWNTLQRTRESTLLRGIDDGAAVYFVHSYALQADPAITIATVDYGGPHCAAIQDGHLCAAQFHPEKSQQVGARILANFLSNAC